jgi:pSer/pThr/pTyr-binding forkhead associated (FHA) protein
MIDGGPTRPAGSPAGVLLAYTSPDDKGTAHVLRAGRNVLGRDDAADITLADGRISGQHAFVFVRDGSTSFIDVSTNGSVVDGRPVIGQEVVLEDGSVLRLGGMVLVYTRLRTPPEGAWA